MDNARAQVWVAVFLIIGLPLLAVVAIHLVAR